MSVSVRWSVEQVESIAPSAAAVTSAQGLVTPARWSGLGSDERALWGSCSGSGLEPYDVAVDHVGVGFRCTCPSRRIPCKHAIALLLMWAHDQVPLGTPTAKVSAWLARRELRSTSDGATAPAPDAESAEPAGESPDAAYGGEGATSEPDESEQTPDPKDRDTTRDERVERMMAGLGELDRWLDDRIRTGLADPALARYSTWDDLAARLVDAQAGSLANRIRRLAGMVGASPDWHDDVLAELGLLHLLAQAGRRLGSLPDPLADAVATTVGWQVRKADVLGGVPDTDHWVVAGRSDQREDRIEVRRHWLRGETTGRWALVLSFAAYGQALDTSLTVGTTLHADLHRYPGPALRAIVGRRHANPEDAIFPGAPAHRPGRPPAQSLAAACDEVGRMLVAEPWLDRVPTSATASIAQDGDRWFLTDETGSVALLTSARSALGRARSAPDDAIAVLLAVSGGHPVDLTLEWTPHGFVPLAAHLDGRSVDIGPRADTSFVGAA